MVYDNFFDTNSWVLVVKLLRGVENGIKLLCPGSKVCEESRKLCGIVVYGGKIFERSRKL